MPASMWAYVITERRETTARFQIRLVQIISERSPAHAKARVVTCKGDLDLGIARLP